MIFFYETAEDSYRGLAALPTHPNNAKPYHQSVTAGSRVNIRAGHATKKNCPYSLWPLHLDTEALTFFAFFLKLKTYYHSWAQLTNNLASANR